MPPTSADHRSPERRALDETIAAEPLMAPPELPPNVKPKPVEAFLPKKQRPLALAGIVENGLVRPLDSTIKLSEKTRVIIVTTESV
jgi:hypothetical protein